MDTQERLQDLDRKLTLVLQLLQGNHLDKSDTGQIGKINDLVKRVTKLERLKDKVLWVAVGCGVVTGGIGGWLSKVFSNSN